MNIEQIARAMCVRHVEILRSNGVSEGRICAGAGGLTFDTMIPKDRAAYLSMADAVVSELMSSCEMDNAGYDKVSAPIALPYPNASSK